ncbi:MAG: DDE-type integrase/transposase/recombinase [Dysgonamonadaceae bacterium]|nr:DDE-type integrase/transposase/recombinase [Dysgonamonadaceae bacterium]
MRKEECIFMYGQIYALKNKGFNISQIAYETGLSIPTIYKYLDMDLEEIESCCNDLTVRDKKLDPYRARILQWLQQYPHMSSAQINDWLLEVDEDLDCAESTVRLYVKNLRETEGIIKNPQERSYIAVPDFEPGKQTQVDWGETWQKNKSGGKTKIYFISFVLSYSRYKYVYWLDRPFSTDDGIYAHELALAYFGGMTEEFVCDQDSTISVNENAGDFILTAAFQTYVETRGFKVRLCKKSDPEHYENILNENRGNLTSQSAYKRSMQKSQELRQINSDSKQNSDSKLELFIEYLLNRCEDIAPLAFQKILYCIQGFYYAFESVFIIEEDCVFGK